MGLAYYFEGTRINGIISDSGPLIAKSGELHNEYSDYEENLHMPTFEYQGVVDKVGVWGTLKEELEAAAMISKGFDVPMLGIAGRIDPFYNCHLPVYSGAVTDGYDNNVDWLFSDIIEAINEQPHSPHQVLLLDNTGHVPTIKSDPTASNVVDDFISDILSTNPAFPFSK